MQTNVNSAFAGGRVLLDRGMVDQIRLTWRLMRDKRVTAMKFAIPALLALYVGSPVDFLPDLFLGVGQMDDIGVVVASVLLMTRVVPWMAPQSIVEEHQRAMNGMGPTRGAEPETGDRVIAARFSVRP